MADPASVPRPPVRFYRMAAVEDRLDAMAAELDALRRRVAELEGCRDGSADRAETGVSA